MQYDYIIEEVSGMAIQIKSDRKDTENKTVRTSGMTYKTLAGISI